MPNTTRRQFNTMAVLGSAGKALGTSGKALGTNQSSSAGTLQFTSYPTSVPTTGWVTISLVWTGFAPITVTATWSNGGNATVMGLAAIGVGNFVQCLVQAPASPSSNNILTIKGTSGNNGSCSSGGITVTAGVSDTFTYGTVYGPSSVSYLQSYYQVPIGTYFTRTRGPQTWVLSDTVPNSGDAANFEIKTNNTFTVAGGSIYTLVGVALVGLGTGTKTSFAVTLTCTDPLGNYSINITISNPTNSTPAVILWGELFLNTSAPAYNPLYTEIGMSLPNVSSVTLTDPSGLFSISASNTLQILRSNIPGNYGSYPITITPNVGSPIYRTIYIAHDNGPLLSWNPGTQLYTNSPPLNFADGTAMVSPGSILAWSDSGINSISTMSSQFSTAWNGTVYLNTSISQGTTSLTLIDTSTLTNSLVVNLNVLTGTTLSSANITPPSFPTLDNSLRSGTIGTFTVSGFTNTPKIMIDIQNNNLQNNFLMALGTISSASGDTVGNSQNEGYLVSYTGGSNPPATPRYTLSSNSGTSTTVSYTNLSAGTDVIILRFDDGNGTQCVGTFPLTIADKKSALVYTIGDNLTSSGYIVPTTATCSGTISETTMTLTGTATNLFLPNATISGTGITGSPTIVKQLTSTLANNVAGGAGTYQISSSQTVSSSITITSLYGTMTLTSVTSSTYAAPGQPLSATGISANTTISAALDANFTGYISGTTLTISSGPFAGPHGLTGTIAAGQVLRGYKVQPGTIIAAGSGSSWTVSISQTVGTSGNPLPMYSGGSTGTYFVTPSQTLGSSGSPVAITATPSYAKWNSALLAIVGYGGSPIPPVSVYSGIQLMLLRRSTDYSDDFSQSWSGSGAIFWPTPAYYFGPPNTLTPINFNATAPYGDKGGIACNSYDLSCWNLEVFGCSNWVGGQGNGGAFYKENSTFGNVTISNCFVHDSENGFLDCAPGNVITIQNNLLGNCGMGTPGRTSVVYIGHGAKTVITGNTFFNCPNNHELKSRARIGIISNNTIIEGQNALSSAPIDLPTGGVYTLSNNIVLKSPNNPNARLMYQWIFEYNGNGIWDQNSLTVNGDTLINFADPALQSTIGVASFVNNNLNPLVGNAVSAVVENCLYYNISAANLLGVFGTGPIPPTNGGGNTALTTISSSLLKQINVLQSPVVGGQFPGALGTTPQADPGTYNYATSGAGADSICIPYTNMLSTLASGVGSGVTVNGGPLTAYDVTGVPFTTPLTWSMPITGNTSGQFTYTTSGPNMTVKTNTTGLADGLYFVGVQCTGTSLLPGVTNPVTAPDAYQAGPPSYIAVIIGNGYVPAS